MKYTVELGYYNTYEFDDGTTAMNFAEMASTHSTTGVKVTITIKGDDEDD